MISYTETSAEYHASVAIGSGDIRAYDRCPRLFRDRREGVASVSETPAMAFGTLAHLCLLEPKRYDAETILKPEGMNFSTREGKAWRDENAGKTIVSQKDATNLHHMRDRMPDEIRRALEGAKTEVTVRTDLDGLAVQCRVDAWASMLFDVKTIGAIEKLDQSIFKLGYHIQQRWYQRVIAAETGTKAPPFRFLFAESAAPYRWRVVELDLDYIHMGDVAIDAALSGIRARNKSGCWGDPADINVMASPPAWANDSDEDGDDESEVA